MHHFFTTHKKTFFAAAFLVLFGATVSSATPPLSPYTSTSGTLDPQCLPGSANCYIETTLSLDGNNSLIVGGGTATASNANAVYIGQNAGSGALNANNANFIGTNAGFGATGANNGNFFGAGAGYQATAASYSTLIGFKAGLAFSGNNIGSNNIIIGTNISLPDATANAINLGGVLFGTGTYSTTMGNPSITPVSGGRIGIGIVNPSTTLDVAGTISGDSLFTRDTTTTVTVDDVTNLQASQTCTDGCNYSANGSNHNWQIYAYKNTLSGRVYSANALTLGSDFVDDGSSNPYDITISWDPVSGADGYRILKLDPNYTGYSYDAGYDTTATTIIDDGCGSVCYDSNITTVTPSSIVATVGFSQIGQSLNLVGEYLNFGTTTGETGFGFRNVAGVLEYKNDAGAWQSFQGLGSPIKFVGSSYIGQNSGPSGDGLSEPAGGSSIMIGQDAGLNAGSASNSNFLGFQAGYQATNANNSNHFGSQAGYGAINATSSNFLGNSAGTLATNASYSNFLGFEAGYNATSAHSSNFLGQNAGANATNASNSNFFGASAGYQAENAEYSNFLGQNAGQNATSASYSNFFGSHAGYVATNAEYSNFLGYSAGYGAASASYSNFFGSSAGLGATSASASNFFGQNAGQNATNASFSNFLGTSAGSGATSASSSNFLGAQAGQGATSASASNFLGAGAGINATNASQSNFLGNQAGQFATNATSSNFFGLRAGRSATNASQSNFFGFDAGQNATFASHSNFFGQQAGNGATGAFASNFFGNNAGYSATSASSSNFLGSGAGRDATNAANSNFFGSSAGYAATNASYSNLFGFNVGRNLSSNNIGSNNIIIGTNISLPDATANAINLGGVLFGTGTYSTTSGNPSITPVSGGRIGIGVVSPAYTLQVGNSGVSGIVARFQNSTGTCDINPTTTALSCSSDRTLKKNITALDTYTTSKFLSLAPVQYNWNIDADTAPKQTGFIAQDVEALFPDLVTTDKDTGLKSLNYIGLIPYTIKAIQEMNIQVTSIAALTGDTGNSLKSAMVAWFGDVQNGIQSIFAKEGHFEQKICLGTKDNETCITKTQLDNLLQGQNQNLAPVSTSTPSITPDEPVVDVVLVPEEVSVDPLITPENTVQ